MTGWFSLLRFMTFCRRLFWIIPDKCLKCLRWLFNERPQTYYELDTLYSNPSIIGASQEGIHLSGIGGLGTSGIEILDHGVSGRGAQQPSIHGEILPFDVALDLDSTAPQRTLSPPTRTTDPTPSTHSDIPKRLVAALRGDEAEMRLLDGHKIFRGSEVRLIFDKLKPAQLRAICMAVRDNPAIKSLELGCNSIGDSGVAVITETLRRCPHLHHLALWGNNIGDPGICSLSDLVGTCALQSLILSNNEITDQGLSSLGFSLAACHTLRSLDLSVNAGISDAGLGQLVKTLKGATECDLETLSLNNGCIGDLGCQYLGSWLSQPHCPLMSLDLSFNAVEDTGAQALGAALQVNTRLVELNLSGNLFTKFGMKCLLKAIDPDHCPNRTISMEDILTSQF